MENKDASPEMIKIHAFTGFLEKPYMYENFR
jgi:hypothetical protein